MRSSLRQRRLRAPGSALCAVAAVASWVVLSCSAPGHQAARPTTRPATRTASDPAHPRTRPQAAKPGIVGALGSYWVGQHWITFTEPAHTGPTGQRLGPRTLLTQIRYPLAGGPASTRPAKGPLPLLVFAPGFMQCGGPYSRMLRAWASAGYVVVIVNFPHSDCKVGAAATEADMVNQPRDMSYVITRMLALSAAPHGLFSGVLDAHQIAATGQSDGGDTVAALGANSCCVDHRVVAVAPLSGAEWAPMPGRYYAVRPVPMLFTQGSADTINYPGCSVQMYHADPAWARYYLNLLGASHTGPYWGTNHYERIVVRVTLDFFDRYVLGQRAAGSAMARAGDVRGLSALDGHGGGQLPTSACNTPT